MSGRNGSANPMAAAALGLEAGAGDLRRPAAMAATRARHAVGAATAHAAGRPAPPQKGGCELLKKEGTSY